MKQKGNNWDFTKSDLRAIWILSLIIIMGFSINLLLKENSFLSNELNTRELDSISQIISDNSIMDRKKEETSKKTEESFMFNPNYIEYDSLKLFGFSTTLANRFLKYRNAIGKFESLEQVFTLYGLDSGMIRKLDTCLNFPVQNKIKVASTVKSNRKYFDSKESPLNINRSFNEVRTIELNSASATELLSIPGVGPVLSKRIIKYRNSLGGFLTATEMYNVYGIDSTKLNLSRFKLMVDTNLIDKININTASTDSLASHPFISKYQAKLVTAYRKQHGTFDNAESLQKTFAFDESEIDKIKRYLKFK